MSRKLIINNFLKSLISSTTTAAPCQYQKKRFITNVAKGKKTRNEVYELGNDSSQLYRHKVLFSWRCTFFILSAPSKSHIQIN
jgi:hypothetical protein